MKNRFLMCAGMTLVSALVSAGFSVQGMLGAGHHDSFAQYAGSRSIALLVGILFAVTIRSEAAVSALAIVMTIVQAWDGCIGFVAHDPAKTYGPFLFALLNAVVWIRLQGNEKGVV